MIEGCVAPVGGVVALLASLGEIRLHVVGIRGALKIFQVARDACRVGQGVIVIDMALRARCRGMRTRQGEA